MIRSARSRSSGSGQFPPVCLSWKAGKWAAASAPIPEEGPAAGTEEPEGTTATGSEGPGETGAAGALGEIMAIHARDGQIQSLCSLVDHLRNGSSFTWASSSEWTFSTHLSAEKEETLGRRWTKAVQSESLVQWHFHRDKTRCRPVFCSGWLFPTWPHICDLVGKVAQLVTGGSPNHWNGKAAWYSEWAHPQGVLGRDAQEVSRSVLGPSAGRDEGAALGRQVPKKALPCYSGRKWKAIATKRNSMFRGNRK